MNFDSANLYLIFDLFLLLLIGMGPKIALVPFLELTADMESDTRMKVANKMVRTALTTSLLLVAIGWFLMRLLHFTSGSANVDGGIVLLLLSLHMLVQFFPVIHATKVAPTIFRFADGNDFRFRRFADRVQLVGIEK